MFPWAVTVRPFFQDRNIYDRSHPQQRAATTTNSQARRQKTTCPGHNCLCRGSYRCRNGKKGRKIEKHEQIARGPHGSSVVLPNVFTGIAEASAGVRLQDSNAANAVVFNGGELPVVMLHIRRGARTETAAIQRASLPQVQEGQPSQSWDPIVESLRQHIRQRLQWQDLAGKVPPLSWAFFQFASRRRSPTWPHMTSTEGPTKQGRCSSTRCTGM